MKRMFLSLLLVLVLVGPLAPVVAQGAVGGTLLTPGRLPPWKYGGRSLEAQAWGLPGSTAGAGTAHVDSLPWHIEGVDTPKDFDLMRDRSLALDADDRPHIAYGGDYLYYAWHDGSAWHLETVDSARDVGWYTSLALDSSGRPHISYYDKINGDLRYAHFDGGSWQIEMVDSGGDIGLYTSLALDANDRPHISCCRYNHSTWNCDLEYAHFDGNVWLTETVDSAVRMGDYTSLALDANDRPHIGYSGNGDLMYAHFDGSAWQIETVDRNVNYCTSLTLDTSDRPHISYCGTIYEEIRPSETVLPRRRPHISYHDLTNNGLKYAHFDGSAWHIETVDSTAGVYTSLALSASDRPHISYYDDINEDLNYAYFDGSAWHIETVDITGGVYTSLALDSFDRPHISYLNHAISIYPREDLKYAYFDGTTWLTETVDSIGEVGKYASLTLDSFDRPHISYWDEINRDLKYAYFDGSAWQIETVDSGGDVGYFTSLALDADDRPHISYLDEINGDLKYAHFDGSSWLTETVDSAGWVGRHTSLALDSEGRPHISYCEYHPETRTCEGLKYARFDGQTTWHIETVDGSLLAGSYSSLELDADDHPHISYCLLHPGLFYVCRELKYARFTGDSGLGQAQGWRIETVDSIGNVGDYSSLALDANDHPHISYSDDTNDNLKYAHFDGDGWRIETVDSAGDVDWYTSLALDASDRPHISYFDWKHPHLKYARFGGTSWQIETVDGVGVVGQYNSLALDASDRPHISYWGGDDLVYAWGERECVPVEGASIEGPAALPVGVSGLYTATYAPPTATLPVAFIWDNGAMGNTMVYSWTVPGTYTITVTASNDCSGPITATFVLIVSCDPAHDAAFTRVPFTPTVGQVVTFAGSAAGTEPITYSWGLSDGALAAGPVVTHTYAVTGTYPVVMTATNECGQDVVSHTVTVVLTPTCALVEVVTLTSEISGCVVGFESDLLGDSPFTYLWAFGDGMTGTTAMPTHDYGTAGTYSGTLEVWNCAGDGYDEQPFVVTVDCAPTGYRIYLPLVRKGH